ncbi:unnamed protein product, partial [Rangifer tarandus platyrhynchus]
MSMNATRRRSRWKSEDRRLKIKHTVLICSAFCHSLLLIGKVYLYGNNKQYKVCLIYFITLMCLSILSIISFPICFLLSFSHISSHIIIFKIFIILMFV